ncbi:MAG: TrkA family potassium uptake protein [Halobacteriales archaeon]|nr:TrkA family potassium uptake protein [Halobacteriales archaeon]
MTYLIVGGGRVGLRTARTLAEQGYEVVIVEQDAEKARRAREDGFTVVEGDGSDAEVLEEAGLAEATAVAGLTGDLNVNFAACMLGVEHGTRTVLRIDEDYKEAIYEKYADEVDEIIYPEQLGAMGAKTALLGGNFNTIADLTEELDLLTVTIPEGSPAIGVKVTDLADAVGLERARVYAHGRSRNSLTIPLPGTTVQTGDRVALIAEHGAVEAVRSALLGESAAA